MESLNPKVLGYHTSHNASIAVLEDGKISWGIEEERVSRKKHDQVPALSSPIISTRMLILHYILH